MIRDGNDTIDGGADFDVLSYTNFFDSGITADLCAHTITGAGNDTAQNIERLDGSFQNDNITGCNGNEYLFGYSGDDIITSGGGTDTLDGGFGTDTCNGDADETYISCEMIPNSGPATSIATVRQMRPTTAQARQTPTRRTLTPNPS